MTTTIKPVRRETLSTHRGKPLVVELRSTYLTVRQKGKRRRYTVTYDAIYSLGAKLMAEEFRREKNAAKKARSR